MAKRYPLLDFASQFSPLDPKEETALFMPLTEENQKIIWEHNLLLVFHLIKKHRMDDGIHEDVEDLILELSKHLWDIIPKFKVEKGYRFNTFAMFCLRNKAYSFLTKVGKYQKRFQIGSYTLEDNKSAETSE